MVGGWWTSQPEDRLLGSESAGIQSRYALSLSSSNRTFEQLEVDGREIGVGCCRWPVNGATGIEVALQVAKNEWILGLSVVSAGWLTCTSRSTLMRVVPRGRG